jgi:UDP-N-acetylmuramoyl-tripeptide--D-alanyl-D-alanine ligase
MQVVAGGEAVRSVGVALLASSWTGDRTVSGGPFGWVAIGLCAAAAMPAGIRWLRVAQREHYLPGSVSRFALRWWTASPAGAVMGSVALVAACLAVVWPVTAIATAVAAAIGPPGLSLRARTSPLAWTARLVRLTAIFATLEAAIVVVVGAFGRAPLVIALALLVSPALLDVSCWLAKPIERRLLEPYLRKATSRLERVRPRVVAVTGSYGKTSTKEAIGHVLAGSVSVVASPASFNNLAGLARAVNEHLADGTDVFVAEMGTYGPGEIAEMCAWLQPEVSVITAIGPVHLERFGSEDAVLRAKSEILATCQVAVLATDDPRLAALAEGLDASGRRVIRCSARDVRADVAVERKDGATGTVKVSAGGRSVAEGLRAAGRESNLACALGVVVALGLPVENVVSKLEGLPSTSHRLAETSGAGGALVLDDTYNSNPAGAAVALSVLAEVGANSRRRIVVTPGMVELGKLQRRENEALARSAAAVATDLVVVGRTNRRALLDGARSAAGSDGSRLVVVELPTRDAAVSWLRANAGPGDVVLFENDLPDHYP